MTDAPQDETESSESRAFRGTEEGMEDLFDGADPQPKYMTLLDRGGVMAPTEGFTVVASRAAVDEVLRDPATYTSRDLVQLGNVRPLIPLSVDPPEHKKYRRILDPLFAPKRMDAIEDDIAARVNRFIDEFADRGYCHFTDELAVPFPSAVFLGLMGLPWEELPTFLRMKDGIIRPQSESGTPEDNAQVQRDTGRDIYAFFNSIPTSARRRPRTTSSRTSSRPTSTARS